MSDEPRIVVSTPEGVPLRFDAADLGARAAAAFLDLLVIVAAAFVIGYLGITALFADGGAWALVVFFVAVFLLRNFYFAFFEIRWRGETPGKRWMKLRVVDARGGPLTAEAVLTRNLTREIELFLPLGALLGAAQFWPGAPGWARALAILWCLGCAFFPALNKQRARIGDLVAGTRVVVRPAPALLPDIGQTAAPEEAAFTPAQLDHYGIKELQVLEDVLRRDTTPLSTLMDIARRIAKRIDAPVPKAAEAERFLRAFYAAQRAHLEQRMLLGDRRDDKAAARDRVSRRRPPERRR